jgi:hypothetical protein
VQALAIVTKRPKTKTREEREREREKKMSDKVNVLLRKEEKSKTPIGYSRKVLEGT